VNDDHFREVTLGQMARLDLATKQYALGKAGGEPIEYIIIPTRAFFDYTALNPELQRALAEGQMDVVHKVLLKDDRLDLAGIAKRIYFTQGSDVEVNIANLRDMKAFFDLLPMNPEVQKAFVAGDLEVVEQVLMKDGRKEMAAIARKIPLFESKEFKWDIPGNVEMRNFLDFMELKPDMKRAFFNGKMDAVQKILVQNDMPDLTQAAKWIYFTMSVNAKVSVQDLSVTKTYLDAMATNPQLRKAVAEGRTAVAKETAQEVYLAKGIDAVEMDYAVDMFLKLTGIDSKYVDSASHALLAKDRSDIAPIMDSKEFDYAFTPQCMKAIASLATENGEFARAIRDRELHMATKIAHDAGMGDISVFSLRLATYVVGDNKQFVPSLTPIIDVIALPTYKVTADHPGWSRLVAISNEASWKQTLAAVKENRIQVQ